MTDYKQLCARFADGIDHLCRHGEQAPGHRLFLTVDIQALEELRDETRAALCAEQKLGELGDEELWAIWDEHDGPIPVILRAAIAADRARWGNHPGSPDSSRPQPAAGEVAELVGWLRDRAAGNDRFGASIAAGQLNRAAELLEQLSPPQPVPVSERLPGPGDCDAEGRCWWWYPEVPGKTYGYWAHEDDAVPERALNEQPTHWLPAHALPQPS